MIYAVLGGFIAGAGVGAWVTWLVLHQKSVVVPPAGGPTDVAVVDAVATAGAPAENAARDAAQEILNAPDPVVDTRIDELLKRGDAGK